MCGPCHAAGGRFDLEAGVVVPAGDRARLERVCRYALRPPIAHERIGLTPEGEVLLELRHRWSDGTTHLCFHPLELIERLAALTPRPRINLVLYYGVLAAHAAWRSRLPKPGDAVVMTAPTVFPPMEGASVPTLAVTGAADDPQASGPTPIARRRSNWRWAQLMQRSFGFDVLRCPRCGGRFRLVALIEEPPVVQRILRHLGLPTGVPPARPPRAPPVAVGMRSLEFDLDIP
ncbi:MAG: hypothetical protein GEU99_12655 [Luteitalea sp.]|nr:hypothetical protein [Luteitalea sp.]